MIESPSRKVWTVFRLLFPLCYLHREDSYSFISPCLQEPSSIEKIAEIDTHIGVAMSGLTADARTLIDHARVDTQVTIVILGQYHNSLRFEEHVCQVRKSYFRANQPEADTQLKLCLQRTDMSFSRSDEIAFYASHPKSAEELLQWLSLRTGVKSLDCSCNQSFNIFVVNVLQQHRFSYNEPMPVESCTQSLCNLALKFGESEEGSMVRNSLNILCRT